MLLVFAECGACVSVGVCVLDENVDFVRTPLFFWLPSYLLARMCVLLRRRLHMDCKNIIFAFPVHVHALDWTGGSAGCWAGANLRAGV